MKAAAEASIASARRLAMTISALPPDRHEEAYAIVRSDFETGFARMGKDPTSDFARRWLDLQLEGLRALVLEIGGRSGNA